ncbi:DMT family transporter [Vibrio mangrovi]|uniref:DMT family transporter n=1 Tax=Vibrio mangrovi TaxID=474394 RepID=A0A1Y6ISE4_9VIBR|nr:DMT family transporter [Vibrio mangrovi]MDW6001430.1 DMT family transporter [Vibrio mangrovi]SMS00548.1 putative DMT superfamily transporter inner membrane protein [Vibrio mangrovi]
MRSSTTTAIFLLVLCTFFWGSSFPIGKHALEELSALSLVLWRFTIAALCLLVYLRIRRINWPNLTGKQYLIVSAVSVIGVGGLNLGLFTGLQYTEATNGALIMALSPVITSLITSFAQKTIPGYRQLLSLIVSLGGVLLVITQGNIDYLLSFRLNHGDILIFCGMLAWSLYTFWTQQISRWMPLIPYTIAGMLSGMVVIGFVCMITEGIHPLDALMTSSSLVILDVIYIGIFGTVAGYLLWINGVRHLGPARAALFFNCVPVFSALTSFAMGQSISPVQLAGMSIVILGLLLPRLLTKHPHSRTARV